MNLGFKMLTLFETCYPKRCAGEEMRTIEENYQRIVDDRR